MPTQDKPVSILGNKKHPELPAIADIASRLSFAPEDGRIRLDGMRMILLHLDALTALRREMIDAFGIEKARGLLSRMGYAGGAKDAEVAMRVRAESDLFERFWVGPQIAGLEGMVRVVPIQTEIIPEHGRFFVECLWVDSSEVEEHCAAYGLTSEPVCWWQCGYASGYSSTFMGLPVVFREVECAGMGHSTCRIVGKPAVEWEDSPGMKLFQSEDFVNRVFSRQGLTQLVTPSASSSHAESLLLDEELVGVSSGFNAACHKLQKVAGTLATVLFCGETGVGKEMFARKLHAISPRSAGPFIAVNCAAIPETLIEAELFGVERGAFTGATHSRPGRFERANGGTLFLDEIASLNLAVQGKLLRALQQREIERVGDSETRKVDVRVVAAANVDLETEVRAGRFRADLFYRLNVFPIDLPPLRDRRDDIPLLLNHLLGKFVLRHNRPDILGFTESAIGALLNYDYPGNIRELENIIERAVILVAAGEPIDLQHLSISGSALRQKSFVIDREGKLCLPQAEGSQGVVTASVLSAFGRTVLDGGIRWEEVSAAVAREAVERCSGNLSKAARLLGITRAQLSYRLRKKWTRPSAAEGVAKRKRRRKAS